MFNKEQAKEGAWGKIMELENLIRVKNEDIDFLKTELNKRSLVRVALILWFEQATNRQMFWLGAFSGSPVIAAGVMLVMYLLRSTV